MNKWLDVTDNETNRLLKSQQFLDNFRESVKSIIKYETILKEQSNNNNNPFYSINNLDKITDRFRRLFEQRNYFLNFQSTNRI